MLTKDFYPQEKSFWSFGSCYIYSSVSVSIFEVPLQSILNAQNIFINIGLPPVSSGHSCPCESLIFHLSFGFPHVPDFSIHWPFYWKTSSGPLADLNLIAWISLSSSVLRRIPFGLYPVDLLTQGRSIGQRDRWVSPLPPSLDDHRPRRILWWSKAVRLVIACRWDTIGVSPMRLHPSGSYRQDMRQSVRHLSRLRSYIELTKDGWHDYR